MRFGLNYQGIGDGLDQITLSKYLQVEFHYGKRIVDERMFMEEVQLLRRGAHIMDLSVLKALAAAD